MRAGWSRGTRTSGLARLEPRHRGEVLRLLRSAPEHNTWMLAQLARGALGHDRPAGRFMGYWREGRLEGVGAFGNNLVLSTPASAEAIEAFARHARRNVPPAWVVVGEERTVDHFMAEHGRDRALVRMERGGQILYRLRRGALPEGWRTERLRPAEVRELSAVMEADRAMVVEELGFDPFSRDLDSYRQGWLKRLREERCWVIGPVGGPLRMKVDQSASSEEAVQLAGIYTHPDWRGRGTARAGVGELCARLLHRVPLVTLYVDRDNDPAIRAYEALGFERVGRVRSVWF